MQKKGGGDTSIAPGEPALRIIMRRLREIMAEPQSDGQARLDKIVRQIAGLMVAEVCSIYLKRQDGSLELFATEGLNPGAAHNTLLRRGEGLVGRCAEQAAPINEPDAQNHPSFSYRPETGEEIYHSFLAVPILRDGEVMGVLTIQNRRRGSTPTRTSRCCRPPPWCWPSISCPGPSPASTRACRFSRACRQHRGARPASAEGLGLGHVVLHDAARGRDRAEAKDPEAEERAARRRGGRAASPPSTSCWSRAIWAAPASTATCSKPTACSPTIAAGSGA